MSTILSALTKRTTEVRNAADKASLLSLENDVVELTEQVNSDAADVAEVSGQISEASDNIVQSDAGADSLSALVDNTIAIYGEAGIPEDAAKQLEVSVEAVLRVMGHPGSFSTVLPSFESCSTPAQYSIEAEEKKEGVVSRILEWIKKIIGQMVDFFNSMIDKVRNSTENLKKLSGKLKEKVNKLEGADGEGTVSLGGYGKLANPKAPVENLHSSKGYFTAYMHKWESYFGMVLSSDLSKAAFKDPEKAGEAIVTMMMAEQKKLPEWEKVPVTSYHILHITKGTDGENPLIGAKTKVEFDSTIKPADAHPVLSKALMHQVLEGVDSLISEVEFLTRDFAKYRENLNMVKTAGRGQRFAGAVHGIAAKNKEHKEYADNATKAGKVLSSLARLGIDSMSQTVPAVLDVVRANLTYVNKSANAHGKAKPAEKA